MIVTPSRIVTVKGFRANGIDEHPAIVTRVWTQPPVDDSGYGCANLQIVPDAAAIEVRTSVYFFNHRTAAEAFLKTQGGGMIVAFWPDRV